MPDSPNDELAARVLDYLKSRPQSQDTLVGIVEWWLLEQQIVASVVSVQEVLETLVSRGLVTRKISADSNERYALTHDLHEGNSEE
jgi:hypothetical protein